MDELHSVIAIYQSPAAIEVAIKELHQSGFDTKKLSIVARDHHVSLHAVEYYNAGDKMKVWVKKGLFGIPKDSILLFRAALKTGRFVLVANGFKDEISKAKKILNSTKPLILERHSVKTPAK